MMRASLVGLLVLLFPAASNAQISVRVFGEAGATVFTATQSFKAILGTPLGPVYGGGLEFRQRQYFFSVGAQRFRRTGHRVFVFENQIFTLNVKDTIAVTPLDLTFGYRFLRRPAPGRFRRPPRLVPYAGGGIGAYRYEEISEHATDAENVKKGYAGYHVLGGAEVPLRPWLGAAFEAQWATVPHALGDSSTGVANVYDEHNLGGFTLRAKIVIGR
jgi:hypothetical protein